MQHATYLSGQIRIFQILTKKYPTQQSKWAREPSELKESYPRRYLDYADKQSTKRSILSWSYQWESVERILSLKKLSWEISWANPKPKSKPSWEISWANPKPKPIFSIGNSCECVSSGALVPASFAWLKLERDKLSVGIVWANPKLKLSGALVSALFAWLKLELDSKLS